MSKLLVASRTRPDIDLPKFPGICEFPVVPLSLLNCYYEKKQL